MKRFEPYDVIRENGFRAVVYADGVELSVDHASVLGGRDGRFSILDLWKMARTLGMIGLKLREAAIREIPLEMTMTPQEQALLRRQEILDNLVLGMDIPEPDADMVTNHWSSWLTPDSEPNC